MVSGFFIGILDWHTALCRLPFGLLACPRRDSAWRARAHAVYACTNFVCLDVGAGRKVAYYYVTHIRFWLDLAATVPFIYLICVIVISGGHGYTVRGREGDRMCPGPTALGGQACCGRCYPSVRPNDRLALQPTPACSASSSRPSGSTRCR